MLKIKDDYDLKNLERLDFEEYDDYWFYYGFTKASDRSEVMYYVYKKDRSIEIKMDICADGNLALKKAFELFKLGIVKDEED